MNRLGLNSEEEPRVHANERDSGSVARMSSPAVIGWIGLAAVSFHAAQYWNIGWLTIPCAYALIALCRQPSHRRATYLPMIAGFLFYAPRLGFFWGIFGPGATALWYVLAFWVALFGLTLFLVHRRFGEITMLVLAPVVWTGLEYFRGELYYLRFTWLSLGMAHTGTPPPIAMVGMYGLGFLSFAIAAGLQALSRGRPLRSFALLTFIALAGLLMKFTPREELAANNSGVSVAGMQLEVPSEEQIPHALDLLVEAFPDAQLLLLSEYTFDGPIPDGVRRWCREHGRYLVAGGKEPIGATDFFNTAYVVGPSGEIVHRQAKSVPIQFFKDGQPAPERRVWDSPWGPMGILICYDLSYTTVVDDFVRQGAKALLAPTMDAADWGRAQHELHARIGPMRAAEYGIPIFRVCSSGISQLVAADGTVVTSAPFPGDGAMLGGKMSMNEKPRLPLDRMLAPLCSAITGVVLAWLAVDAVRRRSVRRQVRTVT